MGNIEKFFNLNSDVESVLILNEANRYYFCGFDSSFGVLLMTKGASYFITDSRYVEEAKLSLPAGVEVVTGNFEYAVTYVQERLADFGYKTLHFENETISYSDYLAFSKIKGVELKPIGRKISDMRAIKSEEEIGFIKQAAQISDKALLNIQKKIKQGVSERDVLAELEYQMRMLGASGPAFDTIVAFGKRAAYPHAHPSDVKLEKGTCILIDFGAKYKGYCSDMTRMLSLGEPDGKIKALHSAVLAAQEYALSAMRAGLTGREVDSFAREYLKSRGLGDYFTHSLGHGLGLEIHEAPTVSAKNYEELQENMVVTCEPGVYVDGVGGVRIEDTVVVKNNGIELLNTVSKEIIIL